MKLSLESIKNRDITVGVIGLGYVGLPLALCFAEAGLQVLGFDIDKEKIHQLNSGQSYFRHLSAERVSHAVQQGSLITTNDLSQVSSCQAVIICVPTPLDDHLSPDLHYLDKTCHDIAEHLSPGTLVSLESTTWPGTTEEWLRPALENNSDRRVGKDLYLAFSPEREDPGNPDFGTRGIPKLVSGIDKPSLELATALYSLAVDTVVPVESPRTAEAAKLLENIFRSVNIALVNELKMAFDRMDIDIWEVIQAASTKPFGYMPFWPGPGLGGHCIPVDPFYLSWQAKKYGVTTRFIELAGEISRQVPRWVVRKVQDALNEHGKAVKGSRILILGMAYKPDVDDVRESPSRELMTLLEEKGAMVEYHDPLVPTIGPSRQYPQLSNRTSQPLSSDYDCFILATMHSVFSVEEILAQGVLVLDTRNALPKQEHVIKA